MDREIRHNNRVMVSMLHLADEPGLPPSLPFPSIWPSMNRRLAITPLSISISISISISLIHSKQCKILKVSDSYRTFNHVHNNLRQCLNLVKAGFLHRLRKTILDTNKVPYITSFLSSNNANLNSSNTTVSRQVMALLQLNIVQVR